MRSRSNYGIVGPNQTRNSLSLGGLYSIPDQEALASSGIWPVLSDLYFYYTTLLLNAENPTTSYISDASTNNLALTVTGSVTPNRFNPYWGNGYYSVYSLGSGVNNLSIPYNANFNFGTSNFTIETWCYVIDAGRTQDALKVGTLMSGGLSNSLTNLWEWNYQIVSGVISSVSFGNGGSTILTSNTLSLAINTWHHFVAVRNSGTLILYVDGLSVGSTLYSTAINTNSSGSVSIGFDMFQGTYVNWTQGYFSNARIVNGSAVYTNNFIPSTTPLSAITNTVLLTCQNNNFSDNSPYVYAITANGAPKITFFQPFVTSQSSTSITGYSTYFDGSSGYLSGPSNSNLAVGTGDFTIEFWSYLTNLSANVPNNLFYTANFGSSAGNYLSVYMTLGSVQLARYGTGADLSYALGPTVNIWQHWAFTRKSGTAYIFLNGTQVATGAVSTSYIQNGFTLGASNVGAAYYTPGYISNLRFINGTALYTSNFTPSTTPLTAITNTTLLTCQGLQITDASTNAFVITTTGTVKVLNNVYPFTQPIATVTSINTLGSALFDGSTGYLSIPNNTAFAFGSANFTIELWAYFNTLSSYQVLVQQGLGASQYWNFNIGDGSSLGAVFSYNNNAQETRVVNEGSQAAWSTNTWYHIALVRNGTSVTIYRNGVSAATGTLSGALYNSGGPLYIGATLGTANFSGYMSNVRLVNGTALYTSNFAPPYAPLTAVSNTSLLTLQNKQGSNNNSFLDDSLNNFAITRSGTPTQGTFSPFSPTGWSNYFDGNANTLSIGSASNWTWMSNGSNSWTVEFFLYTTTFANYQAILSDGSNYTSGNGVNVYITSSATVNVSFTNNSGSAASFTSTGTLSLNTWNYVAITFTSSTKTLAFTINGSSAGSSSNTGFSYSATTPNGAMFVGRYQESSGGYYISGYLSNLRISNVVLSNLNVIPTSALTASASTYLLTCQSNRFIDNSTNAYAITIAGTPSIQAFSPFASGTIYNPSIHGGSMYFNGSTDYLTLSNSALSFSTNSLTIECWFYLTASYSTNPVIIDGFYKTSPYTAGSWRLYVNSSGYVDFLVAPGGGTTSYDATSASTVALNSWNHAAVVRNGNSIVVYLNGIGGTALSYSGVIGTGYTTALGAATLPGGGGSVSSYFSGYISNPRIISNIALYTSNFIPPTSPPTIISYTASYNNVTTGLLLLGTNGAIIDQGSRNTLITGGSAKISNSTYKYGTGSMLFNGTTDYVYANNPVSLQMNTGDYTVEFWMYPTSVSGVVNIIEIGRPIATGQVGFQINMTSGVISVYGGATIATNLITAGSTLSSNTWYHIALTRASSSVKLFINGIQSGSTTTDSTNYTQAYTWIGSNAGGASAFYAGYIDDLRVTKGYARYTANFTAPIAQFLGS